ncbi:hypothetical protein [Pantoea sp. GbtcB22]|uniref:hypothetical protein n=1 Tax=Pantoea sp. GbtcB22 TaxID=2824767 RepID=UPI001C304084|nr:hypothetical protein [Pantoea sp. GbtcB22]
MMSVSELLQLMESQHESSSVTTLDQQREQIEQKAEMESELVSVNRKINICSKNIAHYTQFAAQQLQSNPESFGPDVVTLLNNIVTARVMRDKPELFNELQQLQQRAEEIQKEVCK